MNSQHSIDQLSDCDAISELMPDYAFGLTDPEATRLVEANLERCSEAEAQLADFRAIQNVMRASVPQIEPAARLGERVMAAIAAVPSTPLPIVAAVVRSRRPRFNPAWALLAAAIIMLVLTNAFWLVRSNSLLAVPATDSAKPAFVLNTTSSLRWVQLPASEREGKAAAYLMWNLDSQIGLLYVHDFPGLSVGKTYQLWLTRGPDHISAGTFTVDQNGKGALLFNLTQPIDKYTWARITEEPQSGSDAPNGTIVVVGQL